MRVMYQGPFHLLRKFISSLSFKLSFYAGLILFLSLLAFAYHSIRSQEDNLLERKIRAALKDSEVIKSALWKGMMTKDREVISEILKAIGRSEVVGRIDIVDARGALHYSSQHGRVLPPERASSEPLLDDIETNTLVRHRISPDGLWLHVVNPLSNQASCGGPGCHLKPEQEKVLGALSMTMPLTGVREEIYRNAQKTVVFGFLLFVCISTVVGLGVIFLVNPSLRRLQDNAAKMARGEYKPEGQSSGGDEIAELSRSFDEMSRQINERTTRLAAARKMYKSLFDSVPCYLTAVDRDYRIVRANRAFRDQFGEQVGKHCFVGYKGLDSRCADCTVEKTFADGLSHEAEEVWRIDGQDVYVIVETAPIFDDEGNIVEVLEMSIDVTRLKQLQMELERKKEDYKYLFGNVPCYLTVVNEDYRVVQANELFKADFGDRIGENCFWVYKKLDCKCENCPVEKTFADGQSHQSEEVWRRNGRPTYVLVHTAPVRDETGKITGVIEMSTNITEIKRLQGELTVLGETIAGMSHTIKNILSGLQGGVYVVDSGLKRAKQDRVAQGWIMVKKNVEKISDLVSGILYASKEREPDRVACNPGEVLSEVCDLYENRADAEHIEIRREFERAMRPGLLDPAGIHSALANLVANAVEALRMVSKGDRRITVSANERSGMLVMCVEDNGPGIPEEIKEKLFDKFYSTKGSRGTGLGLVITRKVVEEHGGTIMVDSEPGQGTRFTIEIPFEPTKEGDGLKVAV